MLDLYCRNLKKLSAYVNSYSIKDLIIYPIKSCGGISVDQLKVGSCGPQWDRNWVIADEDGQMVTQRKHPELALVTIKPVSLIDGVFELSYPGKDTILLNAKEASLQSMNVKVWENDLVGHLAPEKINLWLSEVLQKKVFLLQNDEVVTARVTKAKYGEQVKFAFADGFPLLLVSTGSMDLLNEKLSQSIHYLNFRPNIVINSDEPHVEDKFYDFKIGNMQMRGVKRCGRCQVVNVNQSTGALQPDVLRTLMSYRRGDKGIEFGMNVNYYSQGVIAKTDSLVLPV